MNLSQKNEIDNLKHFVQIATEKVNNNNDNIYEKYDEKLKKIKDVCAQYFSKYEKHLINHQTIVKDLERQQDQWVKMLIKPQELNQARLYAVETRIQENEQSKMREIDFIKETLKKLIYAMEQSSISSVKNQGVHKDSSVKKMDSNVNLGGSQQFPNLIKGSKSQASYHQRAISMAVADGKSPKSGGGFFGQPIVNQSEANPSQVALSQDTKANSQSVASRIPSSSEILFLKRLLYLKASIDNESTLNALQVPFEQEKMRDLASPDQINIDTQAVLSGRGSGFDGNMIEDQYH